MELPKEFKDTFFEVKNNKLFKNTLVEVKNNKLFIYDFSKFMFEFERIMKRLTYFKKGYVCLYCKKELTRDNRTLDHQYPLGTGGITITNNLFPCCSECNTEKANLMHEEYLTLLKTPIEYREEYLKSVKKTRDNVIQKDGFRLPNDWVTFEDINNITYPVLDEVQENDLRKKKYERMKEFYYKYRKYRQPLIVDKNNCYLHGYMTIMIAQEFQEKYLPVVRLDNANLQLNNIEKWQSGMSYSLV